MGQDETVELEKISETLKEISETLKIIAENKSVNPPDPYYESKESTKHFDRDSRKDDLGV